MAAEKSQSSDSESFGSPGTPPSSASDSEEKLCLMADNGTVMVDSSTGNNGSNELPMALSAAKVYRKHSADEKRKVRRERKKRLRKAKRVNRKKKCKITDKDNECKNDNHFVADDATLYKKMARHYWDRWQWELQKRKEALIHGSIPCYQRGYIHQIDPALLTNPSEDGTEVYLGEGSFSIVQLKIYRGVKVAVKQFRAATMKSDVLHEASIISNLCHPYLPFLFGICTESMPYRLVIQFYGINLETVTLSKEICQRRVITECIIWMLLCSQLLEAVAYIHDTAQILHNDIKCDNILLTDQENLVSPQRKYQIILTDFGKATTISSGRSYHFNEQEKVKYLTKYPHVAPEVVHGECKQATYSDMYAVGVIFHKLLDHNCLSSLTIDAKKDFDSLSTKCKAVEYRKRPSAKQCLELMKKII